MGVFGDCCTCHRNSDAVGNAGMGEVYPGYTGLVVAKGELRSMTWGFPLVLKGKNGQPLKPKPVNNARADKLDGFMWRYISSSNQRNDVWFRCDDE